MNFNYKENLCLNKVIHQVDRRQSVSSYASFNKFYKKMWVEFCLDRGKHFLTVFIFNVLTLKQIFWKTKTIFNILEYPFKLKVLWLKVQHFHIKLPCQKPMSRQIEREVKKWMVWWQKNHHFIFIISLFNFFVSFYSLKKQIINKI